MNLYKPMLAKEAPAAFSSKDWIFEVKWDGIRAISYLNETLSIKSRNGKELRRRFPELDTLKTLTQNVVLDGEIIVMENGRPNFQKLLERSQSPGRDVDYLANVSPATYIVFDILEKDGEPLIELPLTKRKELLKKNVKEGAHVLLSMFVEAQGEAYYQAALRRDLEGIVAKQKDSRYEPGIRSSSWQKIKKLKSCDCTIFGYTLGEGARKTLGALILGLYDKGEPIYVGKVGTGLTRSDITFLLEAFKELEAKEKTLSGVAVPQQVVWLKPTIVCEVVYQNVTSEKRLRLPRFRGIRVDKSPQECSFSQLEPIRLAGYTSRRNFTATPEPHGTVSQEAGGCSSSKNTMPAGSITTYGLKNGGVLRSWAVPKGIPESRSERRLAIETEDHPLEYSKFEGIIPRGQYGAGQVRIWDKGAYTPKVWEDGKIEFYLKGDKLAGKYLLTRMRKAGLKEWLLMKVGDLDE